MDTFFAILGIALGIYILYKLYKKFFQDDSHHYGGHQSYSRKYVNKCWNCGAPVYSRINKLCLHCYKFYICDKCGKCLCDAPFYDGNRSDW